MTLHIKTDARPLHSVDRDVAYLDDNRSYGVFVDSAKAIDLASLNLADGGSMSVNKSNVEKLRVSTGRHAPSAGRHRFRGSTFPQGHVCRLRHARRTHSRQHQSVARVGLPLRPVMSLFRIKIDNLVKTAPRRGGTDGND